MFEVMFDKVTPDILREVKALVRQGRRSRQDGGPDTHIAFVWWQGRHRSLVP